MPAARRHVNDNVALLHKIMFDFVGRYRDSDRLLRAAAKKGNRQELKRLSHTVKGVAATIGAVKLSDLAARIEQIASQTDAADGNMIGSLPPLLDQYVITLGEVVTGIDKLANAAAMPAPLHSPGAAHPLADPSSTTEGTTRLDSSLIAQALVQTKRLSPLLATDDPKAEEVAQELFALLAQTALAHTAEKLLKHAGNYDFTDARTALENLHQALTHHQENDRD
ncbi:MAG: Hpt domain-containing protein [Magnetococcales bacterium]|nr:Hpt domain-containing protein [Magnetococcales bacterium]